MARKKKHPEHVNHERWLVSYADFITLLFAFFVVMFAVSQVDSKKVGRFTESFSKAVGLEMFPESGEGIIGGPGAIAPDPNAPPRKGGASSELPPELAELRHDLDELEKSKTLPAGLTLIDRGQELVVRLSENLLYDAGDDSLKTVASDAIHIVGKQLASRPVNVRIEGHTDDRPIHTMRFRSNWDLSTARATAVVHVLAADGVEPGRLSAAGYGEFHPVASNATDEGRKQNRRVDIVVTLSGGPRPKPAEPKPEPKPEPKDAKDEHAPAHGGDHAKPAAKDEHAPAHGDDHAKPAPKDEHAPAHGSDPHAKEHP